MTTTTLNRIKRNAENEAIKEAWREVGDSLEKYPALNIGQLRYCTAHVYENIDYYILQSYSTDVAFIRKSDGACFDVLRLVYGYTATSAQHISKFFHDYAPSTYFYNSHRYQK